ncbi:MAG: sulfhydrogenase subunit delta [Gammaproteobacteria bacterium]|jgi:coenzyme F420-reducing hydrogenase gamma subunit|nr:sulfhydrogenase subunit delta [Gammaproteobacteria bacterium]
MKPAIAVHKFASCDGCQLAFLAAGEDLLRLAEVADIVHFAEAGPVDPDAKVEIAFVEGSVSTPEDAERIQRVRACSRFLVTLGACATSGGLQALRNGADAEAWVASVYASPAYIQSLATSTPIKAHVKVDVELWGCPVNTSQVITTLRSLLAGVTPEPEREAVCMECKRHGHVCVMVTQDLPCMGPVTRTGCGAVCPGMGRDCYACYGPAEGINTDSLTRRLREAGLSSQQVVNRFRHINSGAPAFAHAAQRAAGEGDGERGS